MSCRFPGGFVPPGVLLELAPQRRRRRIRDSARAGISQTTTTPMPKRPAKSMRGMPPCSIRRPSKSSVPSSSALPRAKPTAWTRSNACCSNCAGRRWKTPPCRPTVCAARRPACLSAVAPTTTFTYPTRCLPQPRSMPIPAWAPAVPFSPVAWPTSSVWKGRPSNSTPPARRRWSPSIRRASTSAAASATSPWPAPSTCSSRPPGRSASAD